STAWVRWAIRPNSPNSFNSVLLLFSNMLIFYNPNFAEISNILSIGFLARLITSSGRTISGCSWYKQLYSFSKVFNFICGQSLHAHILFGGAGIKVLLGLAFCI